MVNNLVSIIIPIYNREDFIHNTLKSVQGSDYRPLELVLIDDGSVDASFDMIQQYKEDHEASNFKIIVERQMNQGAPAARNLGYKLSTGRFIQFLDSDDEIKPDKFSLQVSELVSKEADFALCDFEMKYIPSNERIYFTNKNKLSKVLETHGSFGCGSPLLKRNLADKIIWNEKLPRNQDVDYFQRAALLADKIVYIPQALYTYVRHDQERISQNYSNTSPVYLERIRSLFKLYKLSSKKWDLTVAILNLFLSQIKYQFKNH